MPHSDRYLLFIEYFNKRKYMSAQSTLGEEWLDEAGADKNFYSGLIQAAVALYHLTSDDPSMAIKTYQKARDLLAPYGDRHLGIDLKRLLVEFKALFTEKVKPDASPEVTYTRFLPKIAFDPTGGG